MWTEAATPGRPGRIDAALDYGLRRFSFGTAHALVTRLRFQVAAPLELRAEMPLVTALRGGKAGAGDLTAALRLLFSGGSNKVHTGLYAAVRFPTGKDGTPVVHPTPQPLANRAAYGLDGRFLVTFRIAPRLCVDVDGGLQFEFAHGSTALALPLFGAVRWRPIDALGIFGELGVVTDMKSNGRGAWAAAQAGLRGHVGPAWSVYAAFVAGLTLRSPDVGLTVGLRWGGPKLY